MVLEKNRQSSGCNGKVLSPHQNSEVVLFSNLTKHLHKSLRWNWLI